METMVQISAAQRPQQKQLTCKKYICVCSRHQRGKKKEETERNYILLKLTGNMQQNMED